jgi:hypothetical protein
MKEMIEANNFEQVSPYVEGLSAVRDKNSLLFGFKDYCGNLVIPCLFDDYYCFSEGLAPVKQKSKWGYINTNGDYVCAPKFIKATKFDKGLALVIEKKGEKLKIIDKNFKIIK